MNATMESVAEPPLILQYALSWTTQALVQVSDLFNSIPGSEVVVRYVRASHQNDPWRTILELVLVAFALRTIFSSRTRTDRTGKNFVELSEKEIDDLVYEWVPEPLVPPLDPESIDSTLLDSLPIIAGGIAPKVKLVGNPGGKSLLNLASYNFTGLAENEKMKDKAIETLRKYGVGSCGPSGFYGTYDVHQQLEEDISNFLSVPATIIYAQAFTTSTSIIPAFAKRGDIIVADKGCSFALQRGLQISRSTVKWYEHGDMSSLEQVLDSVVRDAKRKGSKLTRRFIVTEGLFEMDGSIADLATIVALKKKYKFRLILDETHSFGVLGETGRGLTELFDVPAKEVEMIVGSMATTLNAGGGFCSGSQVVVNHQRINSAASVFSAALPPMLATTASLGLSIMHTNPSLFTTLQENVRTLRNVLDKMDIIEIPSDDQSPIIHIYIPGEPTSSIEEDETILQEIVDECIAQGVLVSRARRLRGQEEYNFRPSIKICMTSSLTKKEVEKAASTIKAAVTKVLRRH